MNNEICPVCNESKNQTAGCRCEREDKFAPKNLRPNIEAALTEYLDSIDQKLCMILKILALNLLKANKRNFDFDLLDPAAMTSRIVEELTEMDIYKEE